MQALILWIGVSNFGSHSYLASLNDVCFSLT